MAGGHDQLREAHLEERDIEPQPVERHEELEHGRGRPGAPRGRRRRRTCRVARPPWTVTVVTIPSYGREGGGLDVEERGLGAEGGVETPRLRRRQPPGEPFDAASGERALARLELTVEVVWARPRAAAASRADRRSAQSRTPCAHRAASVAGPIPGRWTKVDRSMPVSGSPAELGKAFPGPVTASGRPHRREAGRGRGAVP